MPIGPGEHRRAVPLVCKGAASKKGLPCVSLSYSLSVSVQKNLSRRGGHDGIFGDSGGRKAWSKNAWPLVTKEEIRMTAKVKSPPRRPKSNLENSVRACMMGPPKKQWRYEENNEA